VDETVAARIFVYFVKNGEAAELATLLNNVLTGKETITQGKKEAGGSTSVAGNPFSVAKMAEKKAEKTAAKAGQSTKRTPKTAKAAGGAKEGSSTLLGEMTITPDEIRNALIIEATPSDYKIIRGILKKIDIMPRQVLIQATIAEITLDSSTQFGVEYAFGQGAGALGAGFMATVGKGGLTYSIGVTNKWYVALNALATKGRLNVISSPHVLASDNQEAKIDVSREIPLASGSTTVNTGTTLSETTIEYRDTGVILSVTPHINDRGLVTMDISEEVSNYEGDMPVGRQSNAAQSLYPVFSKRVVKTTLTVGHGQTIAIGGLIRDREEEDYSGLPCLIDIPVVKYLAGSWIKKTEKIELIVLITPRVVDDMDDVEAVTNEFKQKVQNVMKQFYPQQ
jgi:general secretion pathway protein D